VLVDRLIDGFSLVYSFFDPDRPRTASALSSSSITSSAHAPKICRIVYLGYWVQGSPKMDYKAHYQPLEVLEPPAGDLC
jgi:arginyl-tRNA--protein-N-Asp/Glu arginylyltransferase